MQLNVCIIGIFYGASPCFKYGNDTKDKDNNNPTDEDPKDKDTCEYVQRETISRGKQSRIEPISKEMLYIIFVSFRL